MCFRPQSHKPARTGASVIPFGNRVAVRAGGGSRTWLCGIAGGLLAAVVLMTVTMLVPINNRIAKWPASGELSRELAARSDRLHQVRVVVLVLLFAVLAVAVT
jgi:Domain of unknown function (DUF1772)